MIINLSLSARILVNAEALNMAESVGNYTRHRKAPVILYDSEKNEYSVIYVPAVSGESLAHSYQELLAKIAYDKKLPVTRLDLRGFYPKFSSKDIIDKYYADELAKVLGGVKDKVSQVLSKMSVCDIEKTILKTSVVADVTGFLVTDYMVKRTSPIKFSYMLPTLDAISSGGVSVTPQLHTRYMPEPVEREQALFYLENSSALYNLSIQLAVSDIARPQNCTDDKAKDQQLVKEFKQRVEAALDALIALIDGLNLGAKRSRNNPLWSVKSIVVALSKGPIEFIVSPGLDKNYLKETIERAKALASSIPNETINIYYYTIEKLPLAELDDIKNVTLKETNSHTEALTEAKKKIMDLVSLALLIR